jgi:hypothetical protein
MSVILGKFSIMVTKQSVRGGWSGVATGVWRSQVPLVECNVTNYHNKWGGLMVRVFASIPKVEGSNFMSGVVCGQQWYVDRIFSYQIFRIGA